MVDAPSTPLLKPAPDSENASSSFGLTVPRASRPINADTWHPKNSLGSLFKRGRKRAKTSFRPTSALCHLSFSEASFSSASMAMVVRQVGPNLFEVKFPFDSVSGLEGVGKKRKSGTGMPGEPLFDHVGDPFVVLAGFFFAGTGTFPPIPNCFGRFSKSGFTALSDFSEEL